MTPALRLAIGLLLPAALVLGAILLVPAAAGQWLGITLRGWCLFGCAPITSLLLALCVRNGDKR